MKKILIVLASIGAVICGVLALSACAGGEEYSVTCQTCENGYVIVADTEVEAGEKVILAAHPDKGYKLTDYLLDGEVLEGVSFIMPEKDVTVSARFEAITYHISYVLGEATVSGTNPETYSVESEDKALIVPEMEGYEACNWYTYCTETQYEDEPEYSFFERIEDYKVSSLDGLYGNLTLYARYYNPAHWISIPAPVHGRCDIDGYTYQACYGETVNLVVDPDTGYELDYIEVNGVKIEGTSFVMSAKDVEVVAEFKPIRYALTYELDGGTNSELNPDFYTVEDGEFNYLYLYGAEKEGYIFTGWYLDEEMTELISSINVYEYLSPLTLYAGFISEDEYD